MRKRTIVAVSLLTIVAFSGCSTKESQAPQSPCGTTSEKVTTQPCGPAETPYTYRTTVTESDVGNRDYKMVPDRCCYDKKIVITKEKVMP